MADLTSGFPKNLAYSIKELNGFSKQTVKVLSDRLSSTATPNDIIRIKLPPNSIIDLRTFCLYFDFTATTTGPTGSEAHFPRYSSSIIDQLNVYINNNQVSTIQYYNHLYNTIADMSYGGENTAKRSLENFDPSVIYKFDDASGYGKIQAYRGTAPSATGAGNDTSRTFCINNWLGIFNSSTPCWDTSDCGDVIIEIRLANSGIVWGSAPTTSGGYTGACNYTISNIRATVSRISFNNSEYYELKAAKLLESSLLIGFQDFYTVRGNSTTKSANVSWTYSVNANSLDYIVATVQRSDYNNNGYLVLYGSQNTAAVNSDNATAIVAGYTNYTFNELLSQQLVAYSAPAAALRDGDYFNQSLYFQRKNHGFKTGQFSINSVMIDTYPRPAEEVYTDALINLGMKNLDTGSSIHPGCLSLWHFNKYYWCQVCSLQNIAGDNQFWRSGLNGNAASILVQYNAVYDGLAVDAVYPVFFNALTKILSISAGRVINIV